jgi:integrase
VENDIIFKNPMKGRLFQQSKSDARDVPFGPTNDPMPILELAEKRKHYLLPVLQFAFQMPSRKKELVNLLKENVDMINKRVKIKPEDDKRGRGFWKPIPEPMIPYFLSIPKDSLYVFYRKTGGTKRNKEVVYKKLGDFKKAMDGIFADAGFKENWFRDTRHYANTWMIKQGFPIDYRMYCNGWKQDNSDTYMNRIQEEGLKTMSLEGPVTEFSKRLNSISREISGTQSGTLESFETQEGRNVG